MADHAIAFEPLAGVRVLDLTVSIAGPYCTQILGALGADVVKVERPDVGDDSRSWGPPFWNGESAAFLAVNSNKRSIAIDLASTAGREVMDRLAARSHVFVQNLRPGVADKLELGFERVRTLNRGVVYCSMGAYGPVGPLKREPGYDPLMQAAAGIMSVTGERGRPPVRAGVSLVDLGTGMWAAMAILAALAKPDRGTSAHLIETSLFETAINWLPYQIIGHLATGVVPAAQGSALAIIAPYEAFETADGLLMLAAGNDSLFARLCSVLGRPELVSEERFTTNSARVAHRAELAGIIGAIIRTRPTDAWLRSMREAGVPAAPVQDVGEVVRDPQTLALSILQDLPHPAIADLKVVGPPISVDHERVRMKAAAPMLGADGDEVLAELGYSRVEVAQLRTEGVVG
jgi:crotonobetainyl-CoA:carnitine CoA-transferase CaiB-like acyl-CoA transferase